MKLSVFNGSPRYKTSNTTVLLEHFLTGFSKNKKNTYTLSYLSKTKDNSKHIKELKRSDIILLAFPLYTDAMPGITKYFIDSLQPLKGKLKNKIAYIVHSGFPESIHSTYIEKYLQKLTKRMGMQYLGTIIKGGSAGMQMMPSLMTKKLYTTFYELGKELGQKGKLNKAIMLKLRKPYKLSFIIISIFKFLNLFGIMNFYWNKQLKQHNAYKKRFAKPYGI